MKKIVQSTAFIVVIGAGAFVLHRPHRGLALEAVEKDSLRDAVQDWTPDMPSVVKPTTPAQPDAADRQAAASSAEAARGTLLASTDDEPIGAFAARVAKKYSVEIAESPRVRCPCYEVDVTQNGKDLGLVSAKPAKWPLARVKVMFENDVRDLLSLDPIIPPDFKVEADISDEARKLMAKDGVRWDGYAFYTRHQIWVANPGGDVKTVTVSCPDPDRLVIQVEGANVESYNYNDGAGAIL